MNQASESNTPSGPLWQALLPELLLLVVFAFIFGLNLNTFEIDPYSELFHILSAKESAAAGRFAIPALSGQDYLVRAPLWTWIVILFFKILGTSLWVARIPAVIGALLGLALTYMLTLELTKNRFAALFSAAVLGTSWGYFQLGTQSTAGILNMDLYLAFGWCLMQWTSLASRRHTMPVEVNIFSGAFGVLLALILLGGGSQGVLLMLLSALAYLIFSGKPEVISKLNYKLLAGIAVGLPFPWLLWTTVKTGNILFFLDYLLIQPFNRMFGLGPWQGLQMDPLFYLKKLGLGLLPYWLFVPAAFLDPDPTARRGLSIQGQPWILWLAAWFVLGLLAYSLSAFQESALALTLYPPVVIMVGTYLARISETTLGTSVYNGLLSGYILLLMTLAVLTAIFIYNVLPSDYVSGFWHGPGQSVVEFLQLGEHKIELMDPFPVWKFWLMPAPFILLIGGLAIFLLQILRRTPLTAMALIATCAGFLLFIKAVYMPLLHRPVIQNFAEAINQQATPRDDVILYSLHPDIKQVLFYLDADKLSRTHILRTPKEMANRLNAGHNGTLYGIIREKSYFNELDFDARSALRVNRFNWKWDLHRLREMRKFLTLRLPLFDKMKSNVLYFQNLPGNSLAQIQAEIQSDPGEDARPH